MDVANQLCCNQDKPMSMYSIGWFSHIGINMPCKINPNSIPFLNC